MQIYIAEESIIARTLQRKRKNGGLGREVDLGAVLQEILLRANELVPSESGSILLDDPTLKDGSEGQGGRLYFLACFGEGSTSIIGKDLPDDVGIVGDTYQRGKSYLSKDVKKDNKFYSKIDEETKFVSKSILAIPIKIGGSTIGVIELLNKKNKSNYDRKDLALLDIFAKYTSTLIQKALDARRFEDLSKQDNLTGLCNDRFFYDRLSLEVERSVKEGGDLSLIFLDLDRFKEVNDTHGHLAGSRVLKEVACIMTETFSGSDVILARYGGDEYVILLPGVGVEKAGEVAEELREAIEYNIFLREPSSHGEPPINIKGVISCSVGVASLNSNVEASDNLREMEKRLIKAADRAMYKAKDLGKNRVVLAKGLGA